MISIVIPTYNRLPILRKCLQALEQQDFAAAPYEIILVDDGSTDATLDWLEQHQAELPHLHQFERDHQGAAAARNFGVLQAHGDKIVFIDSDLVVMPSFLQEHWNQWQAAQQRLGHDRIFTYGRVINTANFENPTAEPYKVTDYSAAYFATGNVMIAKHWLLEAGLFDTEFSLYGWEDLELGVRLKALGLQLIRATEAVGYHWHSAFRVEQIPALIDQEYQRGKMGALFYAKHPTWAVRLMVQMTSLHWLLWGGLSLGGRLNERTLRPLLDWLIARGQTNLSYQVARIFLNWYCLQGLKSALAKSE